MYQLFHNSYKLLSLSQLIAYFYVLDCLGVQVYDEGSPREPVEMMHIL